MTKLTHPIRYCIQQQKNFYYCLENSMATCQCDHGPGEKNLETESVSDILLSYTDY